VTAPAPAPPRPAPTVRLARGQASSWLARAALVPLVIGTFGAALAVIGRHYPAAVAIAAAGTALAAVPAAAAAVLAVRQARLNPWPALAATATVTLLAGWWALPAAGAGWARLPLVPAAAAALWLSARGARAHRRKTKTIHRWAQALAPVLAQKPEQVEQVIAGLARTAEARRVTDPHYAAAPGAAWSLRVTRWDGDQVTCFTLRLPAHDDITTPEFLQRIKGSLERRLGVHVKLRVDALRDEIAGDVLDGPEKEEEAEKDRQERAVDAAEQAAGDWLKGVKVTVMQWQEEDPEEPEDAGPAWPLQEFVLTFAHSRQLTQPHNRDQLRIHLGMQMYNDPAILRADWNLPKNRVVLRKRASFPAVIPFHPVDTTPLLGDLVVIAYGTTEDGAHAYIQLSETDAPHALITGGTGTGKSVLLRLIALGAARQGIDVRGCDPKRVEMRGWRGWPNITGVATRVRDMIKLVDDTYDEMHDRYTQIEEGEAREEDYRRVLLIIDEFLMFGMIVNDWWAEERTRLGGNQPKEHPVMRKVRGLVVMARGGVMNLVLATQRGDADIFPEGVRDSIGARVAMGRQSQQSAQMMFGDAQTGRDVPQGARGVGTALGPDGPARVKVGWLPDPAKWDDPKRPLSDEDRQLLLDMLPPGASWDGPLPFQAPDPGFEDTSPDSAGAAGKAHVRLLYLARAAMLTRDAHLTDGGTGGAPAGGALAAHYGWYPGADGALRPAGTWIGCAAGDPDDRRVYLHPQRVLQVVTDIAGNMGVPWPFKRADVDAALRGAELLREDTSGGERRYTVLRPVPGNDLEGKDRRQRVWDIPEDELIGDALADAATPPGAPPAAPAPPPGAVARPASAAPLPAVPQARDAEDLTDGDRVVLFFDDGQKINATIYSLEDDPDGPDADGTQRYVLNYIDDATREPGTVPGVRGDYPIRLAPPRPAPGQP